jgi:uncharacterized protein (TIGR03437 family)
MAVDPVNRSGTHLNLHPPACGLVYELAPLPAFRQVLPAEKPAAGKSARPTPDCHAVYNHGCRLTTRRGLGMRRACIAIFFCFSLRLWGQSCVTFAGPEIGALFSGTSITGLLQQPDGSYTAITAPTSPPFAIQNLVPKFNAYLGSCITPPTSIGLPSVTINPPPVGSASQIVAFGNFIDTSSIPGAAYTGEASPEPHISVGVIASGAGKVTNITVPDGAATVATADFNNDGHADLAVVYTGTFSGGTQSAGGVAILLGNGDGTFQPAVSYPAGPNALHVAIADLNNDGKLDLAVTADSGSVTLLLGNGDGTFRSGSTITAGLGTGPVSVIAADFNGDGKLDLATSNEDGTISILLGNGDGTFQTPQNFKAGSDCIYLAAADFNKDGKLDLAINDFASSLLIVMLGKGDGTFGPPAVYNTTPTPTGLIITDFNGDGNLDIVTGSGTPGIITADFGSGDISVLLGNGDGTFQGGPLYPLGSRPFAIATADLNGDGLPDLVTANQYSQNLSILLNQGKGLFKAAPTYSFTSATTSNNPMSVALADLNGDGKVDVATAINSGSVAVSLGNGDGSFQAATYYTTASGSFMVLAGDLNGDGKPDLAVANASYGVAGTVSILLAGAGGAFGAATSVTAGNNTDFIALTDVNGDGKLDLLVLSQGTSPASDPGGVMVFLGKGDGTFQAAVSYAVGSNPSALAVGDVNGDGKPDLVVGTYDLNFNSYVAVMLGNGDGTFKNPVLYPGQSGMSDIVIQDMNGDNKPDIVLASCCGATEMSYLLGNGDGTFQPQVLFNGGPSPYFIAVADYNGDGKPDLAIANQGGNGGYVTVLLNTTQMAAFVTKSATAGQIEPFAADSIVAAYGSNLAIGTKVATPPLGTSLDGTTVTVTDSMGVTRPADLFYVSATQVNYEIPDGTAPGTATVTITNKSGVVQTATIQVGTVSPGLFELNAAGLVAAWVLPVVNGAQQALQPVYQLNSSNAVVPLPINVSAANSQFYLEMYGTGVRNAKNVTATVGGVNVPVLFSGPAPGYAGEDQVNIGPLPLSLAGKGNVNIIVTADGQVANTVSVAIQ